MICMGALLFSMTLYLFGSGANAQGCYTNDVDSPGNDINLRIGSPSVSDCQKGCQQDTYCNYFVFKERYFWGFLNVCWLKSQKASPLTPRRGFIFGPKDCMDARSCFTRNVDSHGQDIDIRTQITSASACQELCRQNEKCNFFLYGDTAYQTYCWLKSSRATVLTQAKGLLFGPKSCPCPMGASTPQVDATGYINMCFGVPPNGKNDPEMTTVYGCRCRDQCRADMTRNLAESDYCNTENGYFGQCGEGLWPMKYDWCRYKATSKCNCVWQNWRVKEDAIWLAVKADQSFGFHPTWDETSVGIMTQQSMRTSMDNEWDVVPAGRKKFIHYIGAVCKFTLNISNSPFTGVFKNGVQNGLIRMGSATWVDPFPLHGCVPGVSIKILRTHRSSANFFAMAGIDPLPNDNHNFFCCDLSNHNPSPASVQSQLFKMKFEQASSCITKVGLSDSARFDQDGNEATDLVFPYKITLKPTGNVQFTVEKPPTLEAFQRQFKDKITPGMAIYDFYMHSSPYDVNGQKLGQIVVTEKCVDKSKFGDERLFFQHQKIEEDIALKPEWETEYRKVC